MREIRDPRLLYLKAALFVLAGGLSAVLLFAPDPTVLRAFLLATLAWSAARAYYFAFYVLERYVDPSIRFAGLTALARALLTGRASPRTGPPRRTRRCATHKQ